METSLHMLQTCTQVMFPCGVLHQQPITSENQALMPLLEQKGFYSSQCLVWFCLRAPYPSLMVAASRSKPASMILL